MNFRIAAILALALLVTAACTQESPSDDTQASPTSESAEQPTDQAGEQPTEQATEQATDQSSTQKRGGSRSSDDGDQPDDVTAAGGPIVGDQQAFETEEACMIQYAQDPASNYAGFYPALGSAEHTDAVRSGVYPCATWTGVFEVTGDSATTNQVYAYPSEDTYPLTNFMNFKSPNEGFVGGGGLASEAAGIPSSGVYVAGFDPATGKQRWRTYLNNYRIGNQWNAFAAQSITEDGALLVATGTTVYRVDTRNGNIMAQQELPVLGSPPESNNFDGLVPAPDGLGTWIAKTQNRAVPCPDQGNAAMSSCTPSPNTTVVAFDGATLEVHDALELPQHVPARNIVVAHDGKIYTYVAAMTAYRAEWNPDSKKLVLDESWQPSVPQSGQTAGSAPAVLGDWIILNTNTSPVDVPQCLYAVHQDDASRVTSICPFGDIPTGFKSQILASPGIDAENNLIVTEDFGIGGVYGITLDQDTGEMSVLWSRPDWRSSDYFSFVGSKDQRVVISQNILDIKAFPALYQGKYQETVLWANALTGETIAESSPHDSTALGSLINIGSGGRSYTMGNAGTNYVYQVGPFQTPVPTATPSR